jgi:hypothetical protein
VSHFSGWGEEELEHWAIVVETARAVARYVMRSFAWIMAVCVGLVYFQCVVLVVKLVISSWQGRKI